MRTTSVIFILAYLLSGLGLNLFIPEIYPQYFGRNKVQYEDFDFSNLNTENFRILFYPEEKEAAKDAAIMLERWKTRFDSIFSDILEDKQPLILYANHADFQQTNVISGLIPQGTGGVTEGFLNRITLPFTSTYTENNHVLGHELVHAYQYTIIKNSRTGLKGAARVPLWFIEGLAEYLSIGRKSPLTSMWLRDAVLNDDIPSIDDISTNYKYFPYRYGHSLWAYMGSYFGDKMIDKIFNSVINAGWEVGFDSLTNMSFDSLSILWQQEVKNTYSEQIKGKEKPENTGKPIINNESMNLSPVISFDGKVIALITRADLFTLDLYMADAETGELIQKIAESETDAHFDALRFLNSSGAWSPDGKLFAFVVIEDGDDEIAIAEVSSNKIVRNISIDKVDAISYISWSPDGNELLISGTSGGINDLFIYNLTTGETEQLTNDKYTEIHPAWSPDGSTILFSTDRGEGTDINTYKFGPMKLALMNRETKEINIISMGDEVKHINPFFSPDGINIIFIADPDGISNIYRYSFDTEKFYKITNTATGISGLTELSSCLSVSQKTGRMVFSIFNNTNYDINILEYEENMGEEFFYNREEYIKNVSLPIVEKSSEDIVENYLSSPEEGIPVQKDFSVTEYSPSLNLLYIGQTGIGVSVSEFGTGLGGGISMLFSDLLGNNLVSAIAQVNGTIKDIGGQVMYINRSRRFNWGASVSHIPYLTGYITARFDTVSVNGTPVLAQEISLIRQRVFDDRISLLSEYPFSQNRRLEFRTGFERISYDVEEERLLTYGGFILDRTENDLDAPDGLNLVSAAMAYVGDYSFFGFTSPIDGSRFRFEAEP